MIGPGHSLSGLRRPVSTSPWLFHQSHFSTHPRSKQKERFLTSFLAKCRALLGPQFMKRLSSSSLCHCFLRQNAQISYERLSSQSFKDINPYFNFFNRCRKILFSCVSASILSSVALLQAESKRDEIITDDVMGNHKNDLEYIKSLIKTTLTCQSCEKRHLIDQKVSEVEYCQCKEKQSSVYGKNVNDEAWMPFLERKNILVWRQEHPELAGKVKKP